MASPNNATSSITEVFKGSHELTINGYSSIEGIGISSYVKSKTFSVGGYEWYLQFYPDGKYVVDEGEYISIYLDIANTNDAVKVLFEITLLDSDGKSSTSTPKINKPYILNESTLPCRGFYEFIKKSDIEALGFLREDTLTFKCTVSVIKESESVLLFSTSNSSTTASEKYCPVNTSSVMEFHSGVHHYTVAGYSNSQGVGSGISLKSGSFTVDGYHWYLRYYPDPDGFTKEEDKEEYLSFFLCLDDTIDDVKVLFKIVLLDSKGNPSTVTPGMVSPFIFQSTTKTLGYHESIKKHDFEASQFLVNDGFTVECRIVTIKEPKALLGTSST